MVRELLSGETLLQVYSFKDVPFEWILRKPSIWVGVLGFATNLTDEPDIAGLLGRYQALTEIPKRNLANPGWDTCISIDYWRNGEMPRGMAFAQEVSDKEQDPRYDLYEMPESMYLRVACDRNSANKLLDKEECGVWELFDCLKEVMQLHGYAINDNGAQEIEMYNHGEGKAYAYVPVKRRDAMERE